MFWLCVVAIYGWKWVERGGKEEGERGERKREKKVFLQFLYEHQRKEMNGRPFEDEMICSYNSATTSQLILELLLLFSSMNCSNSHCNTCCCFLLVHICCAGVFRLLPEANAISFKYKSSLTQCWPWGEEGGGRMEERKSRLGSYGHKELLYDFCANGIRFIAMKY